MYVAREIFSWILAIFGYDVIFQVLKYLKFENFTNFESREINKNFGLLTKNNMFICIFNVTFTFVVCVFTFSIFIYNFWNYPNSCAHWRFCQFFDFVLGEYKLTEARCFSKNLGNSWMWHETLELSEIQKIYLYTYK